MQGHASQQVVTMRMGVWHSRTSAVVPCVIWRSLQATLLDVVVAHSCAVGTYSRTGSPGSAHRKRKNSSFSTLRVGAVSCTASDLAATGSDACCMTEGKLCCLWSNLSTDTACCEDGWIEFTSKCCCCVLDASFPAGKTPGIGCCNVLYGGNLYDPDSGSMASAARNVSKPKSMFG